MSWTSTASSSGSVTPRPDAHRLRGGPATTLAGLPVPPAAVASVRSLPVDERSYAQALVAGDERAFLLLIEHNATPVLRICYRILGGLEDAEDAAQEAFVLAYKARTTYRGDGHPDAWMARIATRVAWRRKMRGTRQRTATMPLDETLIGTLRDPADPAAEALLAERGAAVRDAVATLPEPYREVVSLRFFGDLSPAAIATLTKRPEGTVRAQLHRGLARLRFRLRGFRP